MRKAVNWRCISVVCLTFLYMVCMPCYGEITDWRIFASVYFGFCGTMFGVSPSSADGYDGQSSWDPTGQSGAALMLYRENGANWSGPTGFYYIDLTSPLSDGSSYTWNNIYMWAQNYTVPGGVGQLMISPDYPVAPSYYNFQLVLDYVPEYMNWTGPRVFEFRRGGGLFNVPIPTVTNPLDGVRMHLTVYAGPIPEPSSLLTLAGAALTTAGFAWRKRCR